MTMLTYNLEEIAFLIQTKKLGPFIILARHFDDVIITLDYSAPAIGVAKAQWLPDAGEPEHKLVRWNRPPEFAIPRPQEDADLDITKSGISADIITPETHYYYNDRGQIYVIRIGYHAPTKSYILFDFSVEDNPDFIIRHTSEYEVQNG